MNKPPLAIPRSLFAFSIFYGGMVCIAGVLGNKQVTLGPLSALGPVFGLGPLAIEAGIFAFLLLVVVSSAIAELHGANTANTLVRVGFVPLIVSILLTVVVLTLPPAPFMSENSKSAFQIMMAQGVRLWIAGILAYGTSQTLNVTIFAALHKNESIALWLRAALASALSQVADTLIFISVAFFDPAKPLADFAALLAGQMLVKIVLSAILVPPFVYIFVALGRRLDRA